MLETTRAKLRERARIEVDLVEMEVKGDPEDRSSATASRSEDLGLEGCTLFYRRGAADMPLMEMPDGADEKRREKVLRGPPEDARRRRWRSTASSSSRLRLPRRSASWRTGGLVGLRFPAHADRRQPGDPARRDVLSGAACTRSARSAACPKEIPGIPMKWRAVRVHGLGDRPARRLPESSSRPATCVTGKGNIVASRKHAREVSSTVLEAFLGVGERGTRGRGQLADAIAGDARDRPQTIADAIAVQPRDQRGRARRGAQSA